MATSSELWSSEGNRGRKGCDCVSPEWMAGAIPIIAMASGLSGWGLPGKASGLLARLPLTTTELALIALAVVLAATALLYWARCYRLEKRARQQALAIAEQDRAIAEVRKIEEEYRIFFQANPHPMWVIDEETLRFLSVNDAAIQKYGYSREEFLRMTVLDIRPPEDREALLRFWREHPERAQSAGVWRHWRKDGFVMDVSVTGHRLTFNQRPARLVMALDVTGQKRAEQALVVQKESFQLLSEAAATLLFADEPVAVITEISQKLARYTQAEVYLIFLFDSDAHAFLLHSSAGLPPELALRLGSRKLSFEDLLCGVQVQERRPMVWADLQQCCDVRAKPLQELGIRAYACHPLYPNGRILGAVAFGSKTKTDFSPEELELFRTYCRYLSMAMDRSRLLKEARARSEQLQNAQEQLRSYAGELEARVAERTMNLEQSIRSLEGVLYHVAHDLRAPLRAIHGYSELLIQNCGPHLDESARVHAKFLQHASRRMDRLIHDLLIFGRLGHELLSMGRVDLNHAMEQVLVRFESEIRATNAKLHVDWPLQPVMGDPNVVQLIIASLLSNALKFTLPNQNPEIRVWTEVKSDYTYMYVEDKGIGIAPEHQERIFGVFERLHPDDQYPGTGIGLAIVRKGMERLGGQVSVESEPGRGSRFGLKFKAAPRL